MPTPADVANQALTKVKNLEKELKELGKELDATFKKIENALALGNQQVFKASLAIDVLIERGYISENDVEERATKLLQEAAEEIRKRNSEFIEDYDGEEGVVGDEHARESVSEGSAG